MSDFSEQEKNILRNSPLLKHISEKNYHLFMTISSRAIFGKGDLLLKEGEMSDDFFIIISGTVGLYKKENENSEPEFIETLSSGETIDEMRAIQNRTCALTVIATESVVVLHTSISQLHALENQRCHKAIVEAIIKIISDRLFHSNETILNKIHEKKRKNKQLIFSLFSMVVVIIFLCELGIGLYYNLNPTDFCNWINTLPAENTKVSL